MADPAATHYRKLDGALWLLLYCILHADRATGWLPYRLGTIARSTGIPRRTIQRWLARLRREGYVVVEERGKRPWVGVLRWKSLRGARQP